MITERGTVVSLEGDYAWVQSAAQSGCRRCAEGRGCGGGIFARLLGDRLHRIRVLNRLGAQPGEEVLIGLTESALLGGALLVYGLPVLLLVAGAVLATPWGEPAAVAGALAGLGAGIGLLRLSARRLDRAARFQPVLLERRPAACLQRGAGEQAG